MYKYYNANPVATKVQDCTVRAISKILDKEWNDVYIDLCLEGLLLSDMPSANYVWGSYMKKQGFQRKVISDECPTCYTVQNFSSDHPDGKYLLALSGHVVAVIDGDWYDTWDSGFEIPIYYWSKEE